MHIYWHGQNCFKIVTKEATIITDPFGKELGIKPPRTGADIVTISGEDYTADNIKNSPLIFDTPGEYEAKKTLIRGLWSHRDNKKGQDRGVNVVFTMEAEGIRICHLGDIGHLLDEKPENKIDGVDVLMIPVGNKDVIDHKTAIKIVQQIEPAIIIPMHYQIPGLKPKLDDAKNFIREMGAQKVKPEDKIRLTKKMIPAEETEVKILNPV